MSGWKEFVYTVSHDLQEPLRTVMSFGALLSERYRDALGEEGIEFLNFMTSAASRMSSLIADLLAYSRVVHEQLPATEMTTLADVFRLAEENLSATIRDTGAIITHDSLPAVNVNRSRMVQLAQNLLSNAIRYRGENVPQIHVSSEPRSGAWLVSVTDSLGVREIDRDRIFQSFKRTAERRTSGSGVGLAICKAIVHQHGGQIWVEPAPGQGSRFCFTLPDKRGE